MPQQYIIPEWMRAAMSAEELARLEAAATGAAFKAVAEDLDKLSTAVGGLATAVEGGHKDTAVALLTAARQAATEALIKLGATPVVVVANRPSTSRPSVEGSDGAKVQLTDEQKAKKSRSSAAWLFIRNACGSDYIDPNDMKGKNPERYRALYAEALALYDQGLLSPSGKRL